MILPGRAAGQNLAALTYFLLLLLLYSLGLEFSDTTSLRALKCELSSELLLITAKQLFLNIR